MRPAFPGSCSCSWFPTLLTLLLLVSGCGRSVGMRGGGVNNYQQGLPTTVFIVRHAEKDLTPGLTDPPLTAAGQQRALALRELLVPHSIKAIFSTSTLRTTATAQPTAQARGLTTIAYDARQLPALAARVRRQHPGQAVLVVGHSNTILETAEAFGAARPAPTIGDEEYNYLLQVTVPADSTKPATAVFFRYGAGSR